MDTELIFRVLLIFIPVVAMVIAFRAVRQDSYMAAGALDVWAGTFVHDIKRGDNVVLSAALIMAAIKGLTQLVRLLVLVVPLFMVFMPLVFEMFPATERLTDSVFGDALSRFDAIGQWLVDFVPNLAFWGTVGLTAYLLIKLARLFFDEVGEGTITLPSFDAQWAEATFQIIRVSIIVLAFLTIYLLTPGSDTPTIQGVLLITSLFAGLGAQDVVKDIFSGLVLTYSSAFQIGDIVEIGSVQGEVAATSLLRTVIHTSDKREISLSNMSVLNSQVDNFSTLSLNLLHVNVAVTYDVPWRKVHELLLDAAKASQDVVLEQGPFEPLVLQTSLEDSCVRYELRVYTEQPITKAGRVTSQLYQNVQDGFGHAGVPLGTP